MQKDIEHIKNRFIQKFVAALNSRSTEELLQLMPNFAEYKALMQEEDITEKQYFEALQAQFDEFFEKYSNILENHAATIAGGEIDSSSIKSLGEKHQISDELSFTSIDRLYVKVNGSPLNNGDIPSIGFTIESPFLLNTNIKVNHFASIITYHSVDDSVRRNKSLEKLGFLPLSKQNYLEIMQSQSFEYTHYYSNHSWYIYEGDLIISPDQVDYFSGYCFLITGDLIVDGILNYQDISSLFVLGNVTAKSIILSSSTCYFAGTTNVKDALIVMGGSGAVVVINEVSGLFVYNDSDAAKLGVPQEKVKVFIDNSYDGSFGDVQKLIDGRFIEIEQEDDYLEIDIDTTDFYRALLNNEEVFLD